jgi:hypothetical protein
LEICEKHRKVRDGHLLNLPVVAGDDHFEVSASLHFVETIANRLHGGAFLFHVGRKNKNADLLSQSWRDLPV